ncbi:glycosyltransferase 87 family protein [Devosia sp.]|uniref:glycosyltransferase 87 family protein n=1 Tax=Devosia sp. TaxID=1871048 RepID=UPI00326569C4
MAGTAALTMALVAVASLLFGIGAWRDYLGDTLPLLGQLERFGTGPFMYMVPSAFMALRLLTGNGDLALLLHLGFATVVGIIVLVRLWQVNDPVRRAALVMIATALMTPYLHNYDLVVVLCGALLVGVLVAVALILPNAVVTLNALGIPVSPLLILPLLFLA